MKTETVEKDGKEYVNNKLEIGDELEIMYDNVRVVDVPAIVDGKAKVIKKYFSEGS